MFLEILLENNKIKVRPLVYFQNPGLSNLLIPRNHQSFIEISRTKEKRINVNPVIPKVNNIFSIQDTFNRKEKTTTIPNTDTNNPTDSMVSEKRKIPIDTIAKDLKSNEVC